MTDAEREALLDEIMAVVGAVEPIRDGDVTLAMYAQHAQVSLPTAKSHLRQCVARGILSEHIVMLPTGRRGLAYRKVEGA